MGVFMFLLWKTSNTKAYLKYTKHVFKSNPYCVKSTVTEYMYA